LAHSDTIFALSSAPGRAGVAIIRLSGHAAGETLAALTGQPPPQPRLAARRSLINPADGRVLDQGLVLWFPGPASYTGEDVGELHVHGGRAVVAGVLSVLGGMDGLRPAEAGEFSRRAFINGKMDLTQAEGLADLIDAETDAQRAQALRQLDGALGSLYDTWRQALIRAQAHVEAAFDFSDEELPDSLMVDAAAAVETVLAEIQSHLNDGRRGERLRDGAGVAIVGPPNAGKSSLINALAGRDVAIVSESAGTTRDVIEVHLDLDGLPVTIADTAGLREVEEGVEREGVRRARTRAADADLILALVDGTTLPEIDSETRSLLGDRSLIVVNKIDLLDRAPAPEIDGHEAVGISCRSGRGLDRLLSRIVEMVGDIGGEGPALTRARHRAALTECASALERFVETDTPELAAEELRHAGRALGRITGRVDVEDILDVIFSEFCIGK
jgi:tRNA modification GTPase